MPDLDLDNGADPQDEAEAFDETNRQDGLLLDSDDEGDEPDIAPDVYDVTSALGDADDEDGVQYAMDASDFGPEDIDGDDLEEDEDDDDSLDDDPEDDDVEDEDDAVDAAAALPRSSEPGLRYVADVDPSTTPRDDEVEKYESNRELSDAQLTTLGYRDAKSGDKQEDTAMDARKTADDQASDDRKPQREIWEERTFSEELNDEVIEGSGATADDVEDESDPDEEDRLDEGLEETFPASDPVSAKHIT